MKQAPLVKVGPASPQTYMQRPLTRMLISLLLFAAAVVLHGCDAAPSAPGTGNDNSASPSRTATHPQVLTPTAEVIGPAIIGGRVEAFEARFGPPNDHSDKSFVLYHFWRCGGSQDCVILETDFLDWSNADLSDRVIHIILSHPPAEPSWSKSEAEAYCRSFAPNDLQYVETIPGVSGGSGYDVVYTSATLAKIFPAKDFMDNNNVVVQDGSLDIEYLYAGNDSSLIDSCDLVIGIQPSP